MIISVSKDAIRSALRELEDQGYVIRRQTTDASGKFSKNEYIIYEVPVKKPDENPVQALETIPPRYALSHRNRYMVEGADLVVAYVLHGWGGAAQTLEYAKQKGKKIILYGMETSTQ